MKINGVENSKVWGQALKVAFPDKVADNKILIPGESGYSGSMEEYSIDAITNDKLRERILFHATYGSWDAHQKYPGTKFEHRPDKNKKPQADVVTFDLYGKLRIIVENGMCFAKTEQTIKDAFYEKLRQDMAYLHTYDTNGDLPEDGNIYVVVNLFNDDVLLDGNENFKEYLDNGDPEDWLANFKKWGILSKCFIVTKKKLRTLFEDYNNLPLSVQQIAKEFDIDECLTTTPSVHFMDGVEVIKDYEAQGLEVEYLTGKLTSAELYKPHYRNMDLAEDKNTSNPRPLYPEREPEDARTYLESFLSKFNGCVRSDGRVNEWDRAEIIRLGSGTREVYGDTTNTFIDVGETRGLNDAINNSGQVLVISNSTTMNQGQHSSAAFRALKEYAENNEIEKLMSVVGDFEKSIKKTNHQNLKDVPSNHIDTLKDTLQELIKECVLRINFILNRNKICAQINSEASNNNRAQDKQDKQERNFIEELNIIQRAVQTDIKNSEFSLTNGASTSQDPKLRKDSRDDPFRTSTVGVYMKPYQVGMQEGAIQDNKVDGNLPDWWNDIGSWSVPLTQKAIDVANDNLQNNLSKDVIKTMYKAKSELEHYRALDEKSVLSLLTYSKMLSHGRKTTDDREKFGELLKSPFNGPSTNSVNNNKIYNQIGIVENKRGSGSKAWLEDITDIIEKLRDGEDILKKTITKKIIEKATKDLAPSIVEQVEFLRKINNKKNRMKYLEDEVAELISVIKNHKIEVNTKNFIKHLKVDRVINSEFNAEDSSKKYASFSQAVITSWVGLNLGYNDKDWKAENVEKVMRFIKKGFVEGILPSDVHTKSTKPKSWNADYYWRCQNLFEFDIDGDEDLWISEADNRKTALDTGSFQVIV